MFGKMEKCMKGFGGTIKCMEKGGLCIQIRVSLVDVLLRGKSMEKECFRIAKERRLSKNGIMAKNFLIEICLVWVNLMKKANFWFILNSKYDYFLNDSFLIKLF